MSLGLMGGDRATAVYRPDAGLSGLAAPARRYAHGDGHVDPVLAPVWVGEPGELVADPALHVGRLGKDGRACVDAAAEYALP